MVQFSYDLFLLQDYRSAVAVLERILQLDPRDAVCLTRAGDVRRAIERYRELAIRFPSDFRVRDGLAACLSRSGQLAEAAEAGTRSLRLKDAGQPPAQRSLREPPAEMATKRKAISFSLFGDSPRYPRGALQNLLVGAGVYQGWVCRFHVDGTVPGEFGTVARTLGAEVLVQPDNQSMADKLAWSFAVSDDPHVGHFLVRDADSVVSARERCAVDEWLASGCHFHVIRDW